METVFLDLLYSFIPAMRADIIVNKLPGSSKRLACKSELSVFVAVLAICRRNVCSIFTKSFKTFRKFIKFCPICEPENQRAASCPEYNSGYQIYPINHIESPFLSGDFIRKN